MFYSFATQEERRRVGGTCFIEIQYCKFPAGTSVKQIVSVSIDHWYDDSLYISGDDENEFYDEYSSIFDCGIYNNLKTGTVDLYGINYYKPELIQPLIEKICKKEPADYKKLADWLDKAKQYNGFYILGL